VQRPSDECQTIRFPSSASRRFLVCSLTRARLCLHRRTVAECTAKEKQQVAPESTCGRPLGLQFHRATGDLYFADAYLGLMRVHRRGGLAQAVATRDAGGAPLNFANGVDVDQETGHVYFTDSSTKYRRR
jgi:sugar lactone lactonase YvrE